MLENNVAMSAKLVDILDALTAEISAAFTMGDEESPIDAQHSQPCAIDMECHSWALRLNLGDGETPERCFGDRSESHYTHKRAIDAWLFIVEPDDLLRGRGVVQAMCDIETAVNDAFASGRLPACICDIGFVPYFAQHEQDEGEAACVEAEFTIHVSYVSDYEIA